MMHLTTNVRLTDNDANFAQWLLDVGDGKLSTNNRIVIPPDLLSDNLIDDIYGKHLTAADTFNNRCILTPRNNTSMDVNEDVLNRLEGDARLYESVDMVKSDDPDEHIQHPIEWLHTQTPSGLPPHKLNLKVGAPIILLRNLSFDNGLCNGTRLIVNELRDHIIKATIVTGKATGKEVLLPRIKLESDDISLSCVLIRRQFPVRLAYSITINRSQGQTLDRVGVLLQQPVFTHGQFYVCCSRVRTKAGLKFQICESETHGKQTDGTVQTDNIVFQEIL
jgi:hypothetical protein